MQHGALWVIPSDLLRCQSEEPRHRGNIWLTKGSLQWVRGRTKSYRQPFTVYIVSQHYEKEILFRLVIWRWTVAVGAMDNSAPSQLNETTGARKKSSTFSILKISMKDLTIAKWKHNISPTSPRERVVSAVSPVLEDMLTGWWPKSPSLCHPKL
jgi:hypothetical protein